jgi:hypothetical protein
MKVIFKAVVFSIFLLSINCVTNSCSDLNSSSPRNAEDCYKFSNSTEYCCYIKAPGSDPSCMKIEKTESPNHVLAINNWVSDQQLNMTCSSEGPVVAQMNTCSNLGNTQPTTSSQCTDFNNANNLCCFESVNFFDKSFSACFSRPVNASLDALEDLLDEAYYNRNHAFNCNPTVKTELVPQSSLIPNTCSNLKGMAPNNITECTKWSTINNNCCYVVTKYNGMNYASCALLPTNSTSTKRIIDYVFNLVKTIPTAVDCSSNYLKAFTSLMALIFLAFI